jgi:hypothetical protein
MPPFGAINNRIERHALLTGSAVAEQPDGRGEELRMCVGDRAEANGMLLAAFVGRRWLGRIASDEVGNVWIPPQDDVRRRESSGTLLGRVLLKAE